MKLRKLFAWLMTLVMLLGMVPAAHAELAGCNHDWDSGKWLRGEPTNCLDWKPKTYTCSICGATATNEECGPCVPGNKTWVVPQASNCQEHGVWEITCKYCGEWLEGMEEPGPHSWRETIVEESWCDVGGMKAMICSVCGEWQGNGTPMPSLGHNWGDWYWAHGEPACNSNGAWQVRECKRCGQMEDRWIQGGSHDMGEWYRSGIPTCTKEGLMRRNCQRCDYYETQPIPKVDHAFGEWYVVTEPEVGVPGLEQRDCTYGCGTYEQQEIPALEPAIALPGLELTLTLDSTPANGKFFVLGEEIVLTVNWANNSDQYLHPCYVSIWPYEQPTMDSMPLSWARSWDSEETGPVAPGDGGTFSYIGNVTEEYIANGGLHAMAIISSTVYNGPEVEEVMTPFVTAPCGVEENGSNEPKDITFYKIVHNTPANGEFFVPGEVIEFKIVVGNYTGADMALPLVTDPMCTDNEVECRVHPGTDCLLIDNSVDAFNNGDSYGIFVYYTVTEADVAAGSVSNTATIQYTLPNGESVTRTASATAPCGPGELPDDYQDPGSVSLTLIEWSSPVNGTHYVPGERIYVFHKVYNNSRDVTMTIDHEHFIRISGDGIKENDDLLLNQVVLPGTSCGTYFWTPTVTEADAARGYVERTTTFYLMGDDGNEYTATGSIRLPCGPGELPDDYVPPVNPDIDDDGIPNEEDPDMDGDGIPNGDDPDMDGDGIPNGDDPDVDGDGIPNEEDPDYKPAAGLTVDMTYTNTPANGTFFTPGEVIDYLITVTNTGSDTLTNLYVGNSSSEAVVPSPSEIAPGQTIQARYYKLVYEGDAKAGGINSYGHANAFNGDPALPESLVSGRSADVFVPCGMGDGTPSVYYVKIVANAPANGQFFTEGETIKYRLSFGNNTKKDIYNVTLNDPMANTRSVAFAPMLKAGEFLMGEFEYVVTAADVAAGEIVNTATSTWATKAEGDQTKTPSNAVVTPTGSRYPMGSSFDAMLEKYVKNEPANGEYFVPGETIEYAVIFMNICPHDLYDVEVYDPLKGENEDITIAREPVVEREGTLHLSFNYTVTEEDAARGTVVNTASALWLNPEIEEWSSCDSNTVTTLVGPAVSNDVAIIKTIENAPANGAYFVPGEVIQFAVTVQNNSAKTLDVVVLTDPLSADFFHELLDIPGGAMDSRTLSYTVTEFDAELGFVINYAYAVVYVDDQPTSLTSNSATAPCGFPDKDGDGQPDDPYGIHAALDVVKSVESLPLNGSYYQEGETAAYKITYVNAGEITLTDVMIYDALGGMSEIATAETLTPGESRVCWYNHTVTADDVARGYISNTAIGQYELSGYLNTVSSNTVIVDTDGKKDVWTGYPFWPGDDSEYDPGTGLVPDPTPEDGNPSFGTIDTDKLHSGAASCVRTITGRDNVSVSYEVDFCDIHGLTQAAVLMMSQSAAVAPEMQMQAAAYAVALWRGEVEKLYQEISEVSDPTAKAVAMTEYICFLTEVANYEALLKNLHPDQPAMAAKKIAAMWEDKCVTLCYELHAAAAQRKDSLLSVTPVTGAADTECACTTTDEVNGKKTYAQSYCPVHGFPFSMIDMLLQGQDTAEAWTMVRQIWSVELTNAYNKLAAKLGANNGLAMAEYNALTQWMMAREASLIALYPENPEVIAQTMVKLIMDRVNDLCQVTK